MSAFSIGTPFPLIHDSDGAALKNGFVSIGTAGLDAESNQVSVYWDVALTIPAAQPIRTINGYFSQNGSPGFLFVDADDYSITVKDKKSVLVYNSLNASDRFPAAIITGLTTPGDSVDVDFLQSGTDAVTRTVQSKLRDVVHVKDFADSALGTDEDWTAEIQAALNELESRGGGTCILPVGTLYLSILNSESVYSCLLIPANVTLQGSGIDVTILQRNPLERSLDGILIVNKDWDNNTLYTAAGNIVMKDFTISDGAASPNHATGDLIALGHADNVTIQRVKALNHDQHFVDICGSNDVKIFNCKGFNESAVATTWCATLQIDGAAVGAVWGIHADNTPSKNIEIAHNDITNLTSLFTMQVAHKTMLFENINIHDNIFNGGYSNNQIVVGCDTNPSFKNLKIVNNTIIGNHDGAKLVDIFTQGNSSETMDGVQIRGNTIQGTGRRGIYVGTNGGYSAPTFPGWTGLQVQNNIIDIECQTAIMVGMEIVGFDDASISKNNVILRQTTDSLWPTYGITININKACLVAGNTLNKIVTSLTYSATSIGIYVIGNITLTDPSSITVSDNMILADNFGYLLKLDDFDQYLDSVVFSKNRMGGEQGGGAPALISEDWGASDGTNFRKQVDFGTDDYILTLAIGQLYSGLLLPGKKTSTTPADLSPAKIELHFSSSTEAGFATDGEKLNFSAFDDPGGPGYLVVGTSYIDVNVTTGLFNIVTGDTGVAMSISSSTFEGLIRTTGFLKAWASI